MMVYLSRYRYLPIDRSNFGLYTEAYTKTYLLVYMHVSIAGAVLGVCHTYFTMLTEEIYHNTMHR